MKLMKWIVGRFDKSIIYASLLMSLSILFFPQFELYLANVSFNASPLLLITYLLIITISVVLAINVVYLFLPRALKYILVSILMWAGIGAWLQRIVPSNLLSKSNLFTELSTSFSGTGGTVPADLVLWGLALLVFVYFHVALYRKAVVISGAVIALQVASLLTAIFLGQSNSILFSNGTTLVNAQGRYSFSKTRPNILMITVDAMQSRAFRDLMKKNPDLKAAFRGFTNFTDSVSMYNSTQFAIPSLFIGKHYDNDERIADFYDAAFHGKSSILTIARKNNYAVSFDSFMTMYVIGEQDRWFFSRLYSLFRDGVVSKPVIYTTLLPVALSKVIPDSLKPRYIDWLIRHGQIRSIAREMNREFREAFIRNLKGDSSGPTFHYFHIPGAHRPYLRKVNGKYVKQPHSYANYMVHAKPAIEEVAAVLNALRKSGMYDNTVIVVNGDHGVPDTGDSMLPAPHLMPMIAIKPSGAGGELKNSTLPISLADIEPLMSIAIKEGKLTPEALKAHLDVRKDRRADTFKSREFLKNFSRSRNSMEIIQYRISGPAGNPDSWHLVGKQINGTKWVRKAVMPELGKTYPAVEFGRSNDPGISLSGGWSLPELTGSWMIGKEATITIPLPDQVKSGLVVGWKGVVNADARHPVLMTVTANSKRLFSRLYSAQGGNWLQDILIPADLLAGSGELRLHVTVDAPNGFPLPSGLPIDTKNRAIFLQGIRLANATPPALGNPMSFRLNAPATRYLLGDWRNPEKLGVWSGPSARLALPLPAGAARQALKLTLDAVAMTAKGAKREIRILVNDENMGSVYLEANNRKIGVLKIPPGIVSLSPALTIRFDCRDPDAEVNPAPSGKQMLRCLFLRKATLQACPECKREDFAQNFRARIFGRSHIQGANLAGGWAQKEPLGIWMTGAKATITMPLPEKSPRGLVLKWDGVINADARHPVLVRVLVNGKWLYSRFYNAQDGNRLQNVYIPAGYYRDRGHLQIAFRIYSPKGLPVPRGMPAGTDDRRIFLKNLVLEKAGPVDFGKTQLFTFMKDPTRYLLGDWRESGAHGSWSGPSARLVLPLPETGGRALKVEMDAVGYTTKGNRREIRIRVNGRKLKTLLLAAGRNRITTLDIPAAIAGLSRNLEIGFECRDPDGRNTAPIDSNMLHCLFLKRAVVR